MSSEWNEERVERRKKRLLAEYGDVPVEEQTEVHSPEEFEELTGYVRDGYVGGAYAWVVRRPEDAAELTESMPEEAADGRWRALMILGRGRECWGLPGGGLEDGETYEAAVRREVREETNVECAPTEPFLLRRITVGVEDDRDERVHLLYAFFDATYEGGSIAVQPGELSGAAWFAEPPERLLPANEQRAETWPPDG